MPDKRSGAGTPQYYVRTPGGDYQPLEVGTLPDIELTEPGGDSAYNDQFTLSGNMEFTCSLETIFMDNSVRELTINNYRKMHGRKVVRWNQILKSLKST